jgi:hypothetical protein
VSSRKPATETYEVCKRRLQYAVELVRSTTRQAQHLKASCCSSRRCGTNNSFDPYVKERSDSSKQEGEVVGPDVKEYVIDWERSTAGRKTSISQQVSDNSLQSIHSTASALSTASNPTSAVPSSNIKTAGC